MNYLTRILDIHVLYKDEPPRTMPNYILARYRVRSVSLDGHAAVFVYPKADLDDVNHLRNHIAEIEESQGVPAVLILSRLSYRQKEYLLRERIPFIVEDKQIYLPFMAIYLQERGNSDLRDTDEMLPSAQLLLLHFIYRGCGELLGSQAAQELSLTPTSISRASRQLQSMGLVLTEKRGVHKVIFSEKTPKELFLEANRYFRNPVKRTMYIPKTEVKEELLLSGYSALAEYSMLNADDVTYLAADSIAIWENVSSRKLLNSETQYAVEFWRYDPKKLTQGRCVDRLSLALSLRNDQDERVREAVAEMLKKVWRDIHGQRA